MHRYGLGLIMAWLPDPKDFYLVNQRELTNLIKYQCETYHVPPDSIEDVVQSFLASVLRGAYKYNSEYRNPQGRAGSVTTYMFESSKWFVFSWHRSQKETQNRKAYIEAQTPLYEETLTYEEDSIEESNFQLDWEAFLNKIKKYKHQSRGDRKSQDALNLFKDSVEMSRDGYTLDEIAQKYNVSKVYVCYIRRYLKDLYKEMTNDSIHRNDHLQSMWPHIKGERQRRKGTPEYCSTHQKDPTA
jgi:DNA-directed RNA polymerase specialized sigma24 family protein